MKPALYELGRLWEQNKISVATEHLATAITEEILNGFYTDIIPDKYNGKAVFVRLHRQVHCQPVKYIFIQYIIMV